MKKDAHKLKLMITVILVHDYKRTYSYEKKEGKYIGASSDFKSP